MDKKPKQRYFFISVLSLNPLTAPELLSSAMWHNDFRQGRDYITNELLAPQAAYHLLLEMKRKVASLGSMPARNPLVDVKKWSEQGIRKTTGAIE